MTIQRFENGPRMSRVVVHNDTVYLAGLTAEATVGQSVAEQTKEILGKIDGLLKQVPGWEVEDADGHLRLVRTVKFKGFMPGVELVNRIAPIAEAEGHHPDLLVSWGSVTVYLWTHAAGGLTENDFILAAKIDHQLTNS